MKRLTHGGHWTEVHAFLAGSLCFPPTVNANVKGLYPRCASQLIFLE